MPDGSNQEFAPLLRPGFHPFTVDGLRRLCVHRFPESITRAQLMTNLIAVLELLKNGGMRGGVWVDGSYLTEKLNPDDVDILLPVASDAYRAMTPEERRFFDWFRNTSLYRQYKCDNYGIVLDSQVAEAEYMYAYWLKQFGFSRGDEMKGLAVVTIPFLVTP